MSIRTSLGVRQVRMVLIKVGLTEDEADAFVARLDKEFTEGRFATQEERQKFIERELTKINETLEKIPPRAEAIITGVVVGLGTGLVAGVASIPVFDAIKDALGKASLQPAPARVQVQVPEVAEFIQMEWAGIVLPREAFLLEPLERVRYRRQELYGTFDRRVPLYLDAIGMGLDYSGRHREAEQYRHHAIVLSRAIFGSAHESTAAAYGNAGLTLFHRRKFRKSTEYLARAVTISIEHLGTQHPTTAGAIYNLWHCLNEQGLLHHLKMPSQFVSALPEIRSFAVGMTARKIVLVLLLALTDRVNELIEENK